MAGSSDFVGQMRQAFPSQIQSRGKSYANGGRVHVFDFDNLGATAEVRGSNGNVYDVSLEWDHETGVVQADCTCPYHGDTGPCKHLWAVILKLAQRSSGQEFPSQVTQVAPLGATDGIVLSGDDIDELTQALEELGGRLTSRKQHRQSSDESTASGGSSKKRTKRSTPTKSSAWLQDLKMVGRGTPGISLLDEIEVATQREFKLLLDISNSQASNCLWLWLLQRQRGSTGKFGKWKQLNLYDDGRSSDDVKHSELISRLAREGDNHGRQNNNYYSPWQGQSEVEIRNAATLPLLRDCCNANVVVWSLSGRTREFDGELVSWDDGPPWELQLQITADDDAKEWVVTGRLTRPGLDVSLPPQGAALALGGIAVLHENKLGAFPHPAQAGWVQLLRKKPEVRVPYSDREQFLKTFFEAGSPPVAKWPDNLKPATKDATLVPWLILRPWTKGRSGELRILGEIRFAYDERRCSPRDAQTWLHDPVNHQLQKRDLSAERERLRELFAMPGVLRFRDEVQFAYMDSRRPPEGMHDIVFSEKELTTILEGLAAQGWQLETDGKLVRSAGNFEFEVNSHVDWFDLEGRCDFGGMSVQLPLLLQSVRSGERYVTLEDGSRGLLPENARAQLERLAGYGREEGNAIRFSGAQVLLLDAMLEEHGSQVKVQLDQHYRKLRKELKHVSGVKPASAPRGFKGTLRDYQCQGLGWLRFLDKFGFGGCLADDMGLGKTIQVLALLESRRKKKSSPDQPHRPSIAVVPKSLIFNWVNEAAKFTPLLRVAAYHGQGRRGLLESLDQFDLLVTTYGTLRQDIGDLREREFDYAILDEAQAVKNPTTHAAKAVRLISARRRLAMSGTPIENSLSDLWSLFEFLNPGLLGRSQNFSQLTKQLREQPQALDTLARGIRPYVLRRTKGQVLTELPEKTEQTIQCELSPKERKLYDELRNHYRKSLLGHVADQGLAKSKIHILEALLRLRQAACHPGLVNKAYVRDSSTKLDTLEQQLESLLAEGHKALVFSQFTSLLSLLKTRLDRKQVVYEYLDGQTTKRQKCVDRFQNDEDCRLFLISLKAGGQGLNLTAADYVFILDPWWNPAVEAQAIDRAHRMGQQQHVFAYRLIASDTVEEKILQLQSQKRELADSIISEDTSILQSLNMEDLQLLLS
ncbi:MAG: SNF2-related protein [Planctomycetaceae bacterium]